MNLDMALAFTVYSYDKRQIYRIETGFLNGFAGLIGCVGMGMFFEPNG